MRNSLNDVLSGVLVAAASEIPHLNEELGQLRRSAGANVRVQSELLTLERSVRQLQQKILQTATELSAPERRSAPRTGAPEESRLRPR